MIQCMIHRNDVLHSSPQDCANIYSQHFATVSSSDNYTIRFQRYKTQCEQKSINFATQDQHDYNLPITMNELQHTLSSVQESSPGEDQITYSMLKHCHPSLLNTILCLYFLSTRFQNIGGQPLPSQSLSHQKRQLIQQLFMQDNGENY